LLPFAVAVGVVGGSREPALAIAQLLDARFTCTDHHAVAAEAQVRRKPTTNSPIHPARPSPRTPS
jgi:hypothetical protein